MALQKTLIELSAQAGLAQGIDPRLVPPGAYLIADNVVATKQGALTKRGGYESLGRAVYGSGVELLPEAISAIDARGDEVRAYGYHTDGLIWGWAWDENTASWVRKDTASHVEVTTRQIATSESQAITTQAAESASGRRVYAWCVPAASGISALVAPYRWIYRVESADGVVLIDDTVLDTFTIETFVTVVCCGETAVFVLGELAGDISQVTVDLDTGVQSAPSVVVIGNTFRCAASGFSSTHYALAYVDSGVPAQVTIGRVNWATSTLAASATKATTGAALAISVHGLDGVGYALAAWDAGVTGVVTWSVSLVFGTVWGPTQSTNVPAGSVYSVGTAIDSGAQIVTSATALTTLGTEEQFVDAQAYDALGSPLVGYAVAHNCAQIGAPFWSGGMAFGVLWQGAAFTAADVYGPAFGSMLCALIPSELDGEYPTPIAVVDRVSFPIDSLLGSLGHNLPRGTSRFLPLSTLARAVPENEVNNVSVGVVEYDTIAMAGAEQRGCLSHSGGVSSWYDGSAEVEIGTLPPRVRDHTTGVGAVDTGTHLYRCEWEWTDSSGALHHGEISQDYSVTLGAPSSVTLEVDTLSLTRKGDPGDGSSRQPKLVVYRNTLAAPETFYRLTPHQTGYVSTSTVWNSKGVGTVQISDALSDAAVTALGYGLIYTTGDVLEQTLAPPSISVVSHANRLWFIDGTDSRRVWFSKLVVPAEGPGMSPFLSVRIDDSPDGATALGSLDDKLLIFTRTRIYYVSGEGPNDTGGGGGFAGPYRVASDLGCIDPRSVVTYPDGVLFASESGIYRIDRGLQVSFVGEPAQDETSGATTLIGRLSPAANLVAWTTGSAIVLYDYRLNVWTTLTIWADIGDNDAAVDVVAQHVDRSGLHWVSTSGAQVDTVLRADGSARDAGVWARATVQTPWIHVAGINGFQRAWRVFITGRALSAHRLTVDVCTDYDETVRQSVTFDSTAISGLPVERLGLHLAPQRCSAIRFTIYDSAPDVVGTVAAWDVAAISIEIGARGSVTLPTANRSGG